MYTDTTPPITQAASVLDGVAGVREQQRLLDRAMVIFAVEWAKHNPGHPLPPEHPGFDGMEDQWVFDQLYAKGCLAFDDSAVWEFAICAGLTEYSARKLIRESLMLVHLLPRVWSKVLAGKQDVWRARHLAEDCFDLSIEAIEFVDQHMSERTARITATSRERIITQARTQHMPAEQKAKEEQARNRREVEIYTHTQENGVAQLFAELDLPDALALDAAVTAGAQALKQAGCQAPLGTRRAWALGDLARSATGEQTLFTTTTPGADTQSPGADTRPRWNGRGAPQAKVKLFIHLPSSTFCAPDATAAIVQGTGLTGPVIIDADTVRQWFTRPTLVGQCTPTIKVRPVVNLGDEANCTGYQPTEPIREQVHLTTTECVFPFCTRTAHRCDIDHTQPWKPDGTGGATCTCNLAPLCRPHHRLKTHGDNTPQTDGAHSVWSYVHLGEQEYFWNGPRRMQFIRTPRGTYNADPTHNHGAPPHPGALDPPLPPVDLGDDTTRERTDHLIDRLLSKAAMTRGVHNRDYSPMWTLPSRPDDNQPPEDYPLDDDPGGSITFYTPMTPPHRAAS